MIKITVLAPGRLKEPYLRAACDEYCKRLSRYCDLQLFEPVPCALPDHPTPAQIAAALEKEAAVLLSKIPQGAFVIALCVEGKSLSSEAFAETVAQCCQTGRPIVLIIGSSYGLAPQVKRRADLRLSLSGMTFPHQLFRVMLLEQLYRAFRINEGSTYHK